MAELDRLQKLHPGVSREDLWYKYTRDIYNKAYDNAENIANAYESRLLKQLEDKGVTSDGIKARTLDGSKPFERAKKLRKKAKVASFKTKLKDLVKKIK